MRTVKTIISVLMHGAKKYEDENWRRVPDGRRRYYEAALRHIVAWWEGEKNDPESGLPHLAHAVCCLIFIMEIEKQSEEK